MNFQGLIVERSFDCLIHFTKRFPLKKSNRFLNHYKTIKLIMLFVFMLMVGYKSISFSLEDSDPNVLELTMDLNTL
jgi:hypothetical protein